MTGNEIDEEYWALMERYQREEDEHRARMKALYAQQDRIWFWQKVCMVVIGIAGLVGLVASIASAP